MTESIPNYDDYLYPPDIPKYAQCARCGETVYADDLDDGVCSTCYAEAAAEDE